MSLVTLKHSPNWKGGRFKSHGYWYIWKPNYIRSHKNGYVREHIYMFQEHYKCSLLKWGVVHHINKKRDDNRIENLQGMTKKQHNRLHYIGNKFRKVDMSNRFCLNCGSKTTWIDKKGTPHWHTVKGGHMCDRRSCRSIKL